MGQISVLAAMDQEREDKILKIIGEKLRIARENKGLSLRDAGDLAEMSYNNIHDIERGLTNPSITTVIFLAEALGMNPSELLTFAK